MSINTRLDGSAEMCRAVAVELRVLRDEVSHGCNVLAHARTVAAGAWSGLAAEAFDTEARTTAERADQLFGLIGGLAADLDGLGDVFEAIEAEMVRARAVASAAGIPINGFLIADHGEFTVSAEQEAPLDNARGIVERARARTAEVHRQWESTLAPAIAYEWEPDIRGLLQGMPQVASGPSTLLREVGGLKDVLTPSREQAVSLALLPARLPKLPGGIRYAGFVGNANIIADAVVRQSGLDAGRTDLNRHERGLRGVLRGVTNIAGGAHGAVKAARKTPLDLKAILKGEVSGRKQGDKVADKVMEVLDAVM